MSKLKYYKIFILLILIVGLFFYTRKALAFQEEFNNYSLDNQIWAVYPNEGNINVNSGFINISAGNTTTFPFIFSKTNVFPESENFTIQFGIKYNQATSKGDGIIFSTEIPINGTNVTPTSNPLFSKEFFLGIWQDSIKGFSAWYCGDCYNSDCSSEQFFVYKKNTTDLGYHNIEFKYFSQKYHFLIDGVEIFVSSQTNIKPLYIWFGNPTVQGPGHTWTSFSLDYINITPIIPTPTPSPSPTPTPTPTPTLTPSPSPSPSPTPTPLQPIVLLPGLGGSWNHENMILGIDKPQSEWYMTPGIKVYNGLIETLKNAGYETEGEDKNLFVFNYNWTKPVNSISEDLKTYIENVVKPNSDEEIDLIGHSLGGLVARTYVQNNQENPIDQLLTLGSPLRGIPSMYYPWEGGDLGKSLPGWQRIGASLLLHLRKPGFSTTTEAIRTVIPSLKDMLPTFNYLKEKPLNQMSQKNDWLIGLNSSLPNHLISITNNLVGLFPNSTLRWINISSPNWLDKILGLWPDGKPQSEEFDSGDYTVLAESAVLNKANTINLENISHQELVTSNEGQQKIMEVLDLNPSSISNLSNNLNYNSSLVFQIASPATLNITGPNGNPAGDGDGKLMVVANPLPGEYQINLTGTDSGPYQLYIGQILEDKDFWTTTSGLIDEGSNFTYKIIFNPSSPLENPIVDQIGETYLQTAKTQITDLKNEIGQQDFHPLIKRLIIIQLNHIESLLNKNKIEKSIFSLYQLRFTLGFWQNMGKLDENKSIHLRNKVQEIIENLEEAYIISETNKGKTYNQRYLKAEISLAQKMFGMMENKLQKLSKRGVVNPDYGSLYLLAQKKLEKAKNSSSFEAHINALGAKFLSQKGFFLINR